MSLEKLILFKMKAWLDLVKRKESGEIIDSKSIKKHKNDVIRLAVNIIDETYFEVKGQIRKDVIDFIEKTKNNSMDMKSLGMDGIEYHDIIKVIEKVYIV